LELFTNTPCPICAAQNPGLFSRLEAYEGQYHLISFYPGRPYPSCIFYQANIAENTARLNFYPMVFGTPTVAINGVDFKTSSGVSNAVLDTITGGESWLRVDVEETSGNTRDVMITLEDHVGGSLASGKLFAVVVEREIMYDAPNGETVHYNVFRKFLSDTNGDGVDLSSGMTAVPYQYTVDGSWQVDEVYVIAWLMDPDTKKIHNSGSRFDSNTTSTEDPEAEDAVLHIYPNPALNEINITLPDGAHDVPLRIFDAGGRHVFEELLTGNASVRINTGAWPVGSYQAEVVLEGRVVRGRFQVVR
jgi:hypothetical protein